MVIGEWGVGSGEWEESARMAQIHSYRDLVVWQQGMELAKLCYFKTRSFPRTEAFGLTSQIRRAGSSIPGNVAEGNGRESTGYYIQSLRVSQGSLKELESHVLLAPGSGADVRGGRGANPE